MQEYLKHFLINENYQETYSIFKKSRNTNLQLYT